jgi:hypothetical protein
VAVPDAVVYKVNEIHRNLELKSHVWSESRVVSYTDLPGTQTRSGERLGLAYRHTTKLALI